VSEGPKAAIRRLRNGIVPADSMESLSVGYSRLRDLVLERAIQLESERRVQPLLMRGEWGTGKSHFARFVRALARDLGVVSALVNVNARSYALNYPQRFYPSLVGSCERGRGPTGLRQLVTPYLATAEGRNSLERFAVDHPGDIARAVTWLCREYESEDDSLGLSTGQHPAWTTILGGDIAWADYGYKRAAALRRLADVAKLLRGLIGSGLVLVLDEVETIDQLWNVRSRLAAYATLGELSSMDHVWCIFAVTARFDAITDRDLASGILGEPNLPTKARQFLRSLADGHMDAASPPGVDRRGASELASRILDLYRQAHSPRVADVERLAPVVEAWSRDPHRNPRTLIRALVDQLDRLRPVTWAS
jgi:hypothetical protein